MDEHLTEASVITESVIKIVPDDVQELEGILMLLEDLMESVRKEVVHDSLENAILMIQAALDTSGGASEENLLNVYHQLIKALLVRYGLHYWIKDLDDCLSHMGQGVRPERLIKQFIHQVSDASSVEEVQVATQLIKACCNSINVATLDNVVCMATEALALYSSPECGDGLAAQIGRLWVLLGRALVMQYLNAGEIGALNQATQSFRASLNGARDSSVACICLTLLSYVEWLRFLKCREMGALVALANYRKQALATDEGVNLWMNGSNMAGNNVDDARLEDGIALLTASLHCRTGAHPYRWHSLDSLAEALRTRFESVGDIELLDDSISCHREALGLLQPPHPHRSVSLNSLASSLLTRFLQTGTFSDVEECIALATEALDLLRPPHPSRSTSLINLACCLSIRFKHGGVFTDLEECIGLHREALDLLQPPHSDRSTSLGNLASSLSARFEHKGEFSDLEECIALEREALALDLRQLPHRDCSTSLNNLAGSLWIRFKHRGTFTDLEECIALHREALDLVQPPHPGRSASLINLGSSLSARFKHKGAFSDLEECIALEREALDLLQPPHPGRSALLNNLAGSLSTSFRHRGEFSDLEECITLYREALDLLRPPHSDRPTSLNGLAGSLATRFEHRGAFSDLEECIALSREVLDLIQPPHPGRSMFLTNLASSLLTRFEHRGTFTDLEKCIVLQREALDLVQPPHPGRSVSLNSLASSLSTRFKHRGTFTDLEECIVLRREALELLQPPHPERPMSLNSLASSLLTCFVHRGAFSSLEECITLNREALGLCQPPHPHRSISLNNLANSLEARFNRGGAFTDLEECIALRREGLDLVRPPDPGRSASLNSLGHSLSIRFNHRGAFSDLKECIALHQEALDICQPPHPDRLWSLCDLASSLWDRFNLRGIPEDIQNTLDYFQQGAKYTTGSLIERLKSSQGWATCAQNHFPGLTLDAYKYSMELLPQLASLDLTLQQRHDALQHSRDLVGNAARYTINAGHLEWAVIFLSTGRSIFWSQALQLRTPVNELMATHPDTAKTFTTISRQLEKASYSQSGSLSSSSLSVAEELQGGIGSNPSLHTLANQRQHTIEEIRRIPGYEGFLLPPSFSDLQYAAKNGPVILLTMSESGCDVLIMHQTKPAEHIPLPGIDSEILKSLKSFVHMPMISETTLEIPQNVHNSLRKILGRDMVLKTGMSITRYQGLHFILECLWLGLVKPVLTALGAEKTDTPTRRVWWCPTGLFAGLPIHAAGIYSEDNMPIDCLFQYVVSSYCTSPQDLLHPPPLISESFKLTAVIEPEAPNAGRLPATLTELDRIKEHVPDQQHVITHVGLTNRPNQVDHVLSDIQQSSLVHFGCHGRQDFNNPLESFLLLSGGKLTMSQLIRDCQVPEGALAYLSACETAKGDEERPDESLNLVATMMFAGFRSVVGTLWSILDDDAPIVADVFYRHLFRNGKDAPPDVRDAAYGLHLATKELRDRGRPLYSWVPYVHYGI